MIEAKGSLLDRLYKRQLFIYKGDKAQAKRAVRAELRHNMVLAGLWLPRRMVH